MKKAEYQVNQKWMALDNNGIDKKMYYIDRAINKRVSCIIKNT